MLSLPMEINQKDDEQSIKQPSGPVTSSVSHVSILCIYITVAASAHYARACRVATEVL